MDHAAKDTPKQENQKRSLIGVGGIKGGGGVVVWGGVAVVATLIVASYSAIKSMKRRAYDKTKATINEISKGSGLSETKNNDCNIEIIGKMKHDKAINKNDDNIKIDHEVNAQGTKQNETIKVVPNKAHVEAEHKEQIKREQDHKHRENIAKRDEELAEEIEVETPRTMDSEYEDDSDENIMQHMRNERESVHRKGIEETEEESDDTSEEEEDDDDDDGEDSEESSEGTCDSSIESNVDAIWPRETMDDMLVESTKRKIDNRILKENTNNNNYIKTETEEKGNKNDVCVTNLSKIEDSGKSVSTSNKGSIKKLPSYSFNASVWILALVLTLALAAPLILSAGGVVKLTLAIFFGVGLYRAMNTII